jgi:hypothetical protein
MSRRQRQHDELSELCRAGSVLRAIDLAFEHLASFGPDDEVIDLLAGAIEQADAGDAARRRLTELRRSHE